VDTPNAAHFIYIPVMILLGVVIGWILGSRAARDAYLAEMRKREQRAARTKNEELRTRN
jgi:heme exporter protein D